jgi:hypothetical protein
VGVRGPPALTSAGAGGGGVEELTAILNDRLMPVIERGSSLAGLRSLLDEGVFQAAGIRGPAQQVLAAVL